MRSQGVIDVIRSAYRLDLDEDDWLTSIADTIREAVAPFVEVTHGAIASVRTPSYDSPFHFRSRAMVPCEADMLDCVDRFEQKATIHVCSKECVKILHHNTFCRTLGEFGVQNGIRLENFREPYGSFLSLHDVQDMPTIQGSDDAGTTLALQIPVKADVSIPPRLRHDWPCILAPRCDCARR